MLGILIAGMIGYLAQGGLRAIAADTGDSNDESGVEVLTQGPVHEAFAEPNSYNPTQGIVVPKEAPAAIEEIPPNEKPDGDALWIPGYWQWDNDRADFIWVSGIWRVPPPGCSWVPGYWTAVDEGWTWTPGFWMASETDQVTYLPQPPRSLEVGPSSPAPSPNYIWAPGCWFWTESRYAWRPGYWVQARPDWIWSPAYYIDTPRGSIYIDGYWDWSIDRRGVLFAPAYIGRSVWGRPGFVYCPSIVIQTDLLTAHLFISPRYGHYYFGDYYGADYSRRGIYPWFEFHKKHHGYDPIYAHERWRQSRKDSHWEDHVRENYDYRMKHAEARPPRIYSAQAAFVARAPERERKSIRIAAPLSEVAKRRDTPIRYEKINEGQRNSLGGQGKDLAKFRDQRAQWESPGRQTRTVKPAPAVSRTPKKTTTVPGELSRRPDGVQTVRPSREPVNVQPNRAPKQQREIRTVQPKVSEKTYRAPQSTESRSQKIPRSPVVGRRVDTLDRGGNPPGRPEVPKLDSNARSRSVERSNPAPATSRSSAPPERTARDKGGKSGEQR